MRIKSVRIQNYRSYQDELINLGKYTSFVGQNGAGKSSVLCALNVFFQETAYSSTNNSTLTEEDLCNKDTSQPIRITVTFSDIPESAKEEFSAYIRHDELVITAEAEFQPSAGHATVKQYGQRLVMRAFAPFFEREKEGGTVSELREIYTRLRDDIPQLPNETTKPRMISALRAYEEANPALCELLPSHDNFYGFSKGRDRLEKYMQWIYVPAVKDATSEATESKLSAFGQLIARNIRSQVKFDEEIQKIRNDAFEQYKQLLDSQQNVLTSLSESLTEKLRQWAHPDAKALIKWSDDPKKSVQVELPIARALAGDGFFQGDLTRFGHGFQRSYLLALLQELATSEATDAPTLILGCEEPELYQHPPQARHLASVLSRLSDGNTQVITTTHSPVFITGRYFESLRMVRRSGDARLSQVRQPEFSLIAEKYASVTGKPLVRPTAQQARLHQALQPQLNEMFFANNIVFVEGIEDVAYISSWMTIHNQWDEFRRLGAHIVPVNGKSNFIEPLIIAELLGIPAFCIFDGDGSSPNKQEHEKDNVALLKILGGDPSNPFPAEIAWGNRFVQWPDDLGVAIRADLPSAAWDETFGAARKSIGNPPGNYKKNPYHISLHLDEIVKRGLNLGTLEKLVNAILEFSRVRADDSGTQ